MQYSAYGFTIWYGTPDAPSPDAAGGAGMPACITVGVRPAHVSNTVEVCFSVDGGLWRSFRCVRIERSEAAGGEYFSGVFPDVAAGARVSYRVIFLNTGRRIASDTVAEFTAPCASTAAPKREDASRLPLSPRFGYNLDFLARVEVNVELPLGVIGKTSDGLHINFYIAGGTLKGPKLNAVFQPRGGDWMRFRPDNVGIASIRTTIETNDGALVLGEYGGVLELGPNGYDNACAGIFPDHAPAVVTPQYLTASPAYAWLARLQCVGIGFLDQKQGQLNFDLYGVHPESKQS